MKYVAIIDNAFGIKYNLSIQEAYLFGYLYTAPTWAVPKQIGSKIYYFVSRTKVIADMPLITDKPDTIYRYFKSLAEKGIIEFVKEGVCDYISITVKGKEWNTIKSEKNPNTMSENNPSEVGKKSDILVYYNDTLSSSNKENSKISENKEFLLKNYSLDSLKFSLQQQTPAKYEILKKQHKVKLDELLQNFLTFHENKPYPSFEHIAKHLLSYNFIKSEVSKEKNFAPKKESFYAPATPAKVYKKPELTAEEREEYRKQLELKNKLK